MTETTHDPAGHYDRVTEAWRLLLGEEFHYGVFESGDEPLSEATSELTERMIAAAELGSGVELLDVGCGTGAPACLLAERLGVRVLGITTSAVGVEEATARARAEGLEDLVRFEVRDGAETGLEDASFDRVWALESSHLIRDREGLLAECARVLRPGGRLILCDIIRHREIPFAEVRGRMRDFVTLREAFGDAHMEPLESYAGWLRAAGLVPDQSHDLTAATLPTFERWRANAERHHDPVRELLGEEGLATFVRATEILEEFWRDGTLGYGLIAASKPGADGGRAQADRPADS